jgi:hypothetical protein
MCGATIEETGRKCDACGEQLWRSTSFKNWQTPDRAYRLVARPLAVFLGLGGVGLFLVSAFSAFQITYIPFVESPAARRLIFEAVALLNVVFGIGIWLRSRMLWLGFFIYVVLGTGLGVVGALFDPPQESDAIDRVTFALFGGLLNAFIVAALYAATKPAFARFTRDS